MSILIKDMEMPKSCMECPFSDKIAWCLVPGNWRQRYYLPEEGISEDCPLSEIEPCDDAVGRKAVEYLLAYYLGGDMYTEAIADLRNLPSVLAERKEQ